MMDSIQQTPINELSCGDVELNNSTYQLLLVDRQPCVEVNGRRYHSQDDLIRGATELQHISHNVEQLQNLASLLMFSRFGARYKVENVEDFKDLFTRKLQDENLEFDEGTTGYTDLDPQEIESMHEPTIKGKAFVFYCIEERFQIPYKVTFPMPLREGVTPEMELLGNASD